MPSKKPKQSAVSDKRHGTGLIAPGKQVTKQRSITHLSGHANGKSTHLNPTIQSLHLNSAATSQHPAHDNNADASSEDMGPLSRSDGERGGYYGQSQNRHNSIQDRRASHADHGITDLTNGDAGIPEAPSASQYDNLQTLVGPHYRWDMLAILLLLLQLPTPVQLLVELAFVFLILGNDATNWISRWLSLSDCWGRVQTSNPSIGTSLVSDAAFFCFYLILPHPFQDLVLDFALAVIAICLGGGTAVRDSWRQSAMCGITVLLSYFLRSAERRQHVIHRVWSFTSRLSFGQSLVPAATLDFGSASPDFARDSFRHLQNWFQFMPTWALTWLRTMLGIHIGTYGLIRAVRRSVERHKEMSGTKADTRLDLELAPAFFSASPFASQDSTVDGARNVSTDGRPPGPPPAAMAKTTSSGRSKRKQATFVRTQQPFWAAIAQVKLTFDSDLELSQAEHMGFEVGGKKGQHQFRGSGLESLEQGAFITNVEDTEIGFSAVLTAPAEAHESEQTSSERERRGSLGSKYVDVRIGGAFWGSVDCTDQARSEAHPSKCFVEGKIYGLMPLASYFVEIIATASHTVLYSASISTRPVVNSSRGPTMPTQAQDSLRTLSPTTTLKTSIATMEGKLSDYKAKLNKTRKAHQTASKGLKQEVSELSRSLQSCGMDERQRQRQLQYQQNIKQAESTTQDLANQLARMGEIPKRDKQAYEASKKRHKAAADRTQALKKALDAAKRESQKTISEAQSENAKIQTKREKAETRLASINDRRKTTVDENNAKRNARALGDSQHRQRIEYLRSQERADRNRLQSMNTQRDEAEARAGQLAQQFVYNNSYAPTFTSQQSSDPHTPENNYGNMAAPSNRAPPPGLGYMYPIGTPANASQSQHFRQDSTRQRHNRSSSMLSNMSGFTDDATGTSSSPSYDGQYIPRNGSSSSGNTASQPMSPHPKLSPIGTEVGRGSPRQAKK